MQSVKEAAAAFLASKRVAVTGVSRTPKTHGSNNVYQRLRERGYEGRSAIRERLARELAGLPDATYTVVSFVEQGDSFTDEWTFVGTHTGPFLLPDGTQLPPTGKRVEIRGMELVQVRDGKIVIDNLYWDNLAVLAQLGLMPQGATA